MKVWWGVQELNLPAFAGKTAAARPMSYRPAAYRIGVPGRNPSRDIPLDRNEKWIENNRSMGYVNIETAHILRALHESRTPTIVTPGRFGSMWLALTL